MPAPRAHVFPTYARGAGTHGYVLTVHTEAFWNPHTGGRRQFCLPRKAHVDFLLGPEKFTKETVGSYTFSV